MPPKHLLPGLVVTRNGRDVPSTAWDQELPIDAGGYVIEATAPGYKPQALRVEVAPQGKLTITVPALVKRERIDPGP
jgi:hypothetical protein